MLFTKLVLENYGVYSGINEIDITSSPEKPLILFGGLNGNGKTTILESMMVVLYGKTYLGSQATKKEYETFIFEKMHKSSRVKAKHSSISMSFSSYHNNEENHYTVKRSWDRDSGSIAESLHVERNGNPTKMASEQWRQFIEGIIPHGVANLFFFDSEKITRIIKSNKKDTNIELKKSFDTLLGTDLIKKLRADLEVYIMRRSGKADPTLVKQYEAQHEEKKTLQDDIRIIREECKRKVVERDELSEQIKVLDDEVMGMGGTYVEKRDDMIAKRGVLKERERKLGEEIAEKLSKETPLLLLPKAFLAKITDGLNSDIERIGGVSAETLIKKNIGEIKSDIESGQIKVTKSSKDAIYDILDRIYKSSKSEGELVFDMSPNERADILHAISNISEDAKSLRTLAIEYADIKKELVQTEVDISNVPRDDEIGPKISKLNNLNKEMGAITTEIVELEGRISSKESYIKIIQTRLEKLIKSVHGNEKSGTSVTLAGRMQEVLDLYYAQLKEKKITQLETNLLDTLRILSRKDMIGKVSVDRDTFAITVYDKDGDPIPGGIFSMGEGQTIGTALLWALAKTSERSLPFVIDTPLGRLDSKHRAKLLESFYLSASHQIIVLSTDEEIRAKEYKMLKDSISHSYCLEHDDVKLVTSIQDGYFGREEIAA